MKKKKDFILIANPISGSGKALHVTEQAYAELTASGQSGSCRFTSGAGDAKRFSEEAVTAGIPKVIACGGDGTLHEVVNGIVSVPETILGILPCGRGNDYAAAIGVPHRPHAAIQTLLEGAPVRVDIGKTRGLTSSERHYFTTIATCGYDSEVSRRGAKRNIPLKGTAAYVYAAIVTLFDYQCPYSKIEGDFGSYDGYVLLAATGITQRYGGGFRMLPEARYDDGLFDVCIIRPVPKLTILRLLVTLFWGGHVSHAAVEFHRTRTLQIETEPSMRLWADGEQICETPAILDIVPRALTVLAPV